MKKMNSGLAIGTLLVGVALTSASPASAETPSGSYTSVVNNVEGPAPISAGDTDLVSLTPCGPDCTNLVVGQGKTRELHPQGSLWVGVTPMGTQGNVMTSTLDATTWTLTENLMGATIVSTLTKNG